MFQIQEKLLGKRKEKLKIGTSLFERDFSLPKEGVKSIDDISFDVKFENSIYRRKSESYLSHTVFDNKRFKTCIPNTFAKDSRFTEEDK